MQEVVRCRRGVATYDTLLRNVARWALGSHLLMPETVTVAHRRRLAYVPLFIVYIYIYILYMIIYDSESLTLTANGRPLAIQALFVSHSGLPSRIMGRPSRTGK